MTNAFSGKCTSSGQSSTSADRRLVEGHGQHRLKRARERHSPRRPGLLETVLRPLRKPGVLRRRHSHRVAGSACAYPVVTQRYREVVFVLLR